MATYSKIITGHINTDVDLYGHLYVKYKWPYKHNKYLKGSPLKEKIIGRIEEQKLLEKIFDSKHAEFLANLWSRRFRVGKPILIKRYFSNKSCYYFQITGIKDGTMKEQLHAFTRTVEKTFYQPGLRLKNRLPG